MTILHGFCILSALIFLLIGLAGISRTAYLDAMRTMSAEGRMVLKMKMRRTESAIALFSLSTGICGFIPCVLLSHPEYYWWAAAVQACGAGVAILILGAIVAPREFTSILKRVEESVNVNKNNRSTANEKLLRVMRKVRLGKRMTFYGSTFTFLVLCLWGLWPFLIIKIAYILPILYCLACSAAISLIWMTTTTNSIVFKRPSMSLNRVSLPFGTPGRRSRSSIGSPTDVTVSALDPLPQTPAF
jgi:hypothetical protein